MFGGKEGTPSTAVRIQANKAAHKSNTLRFIILGLLEVGLSITTSSAMQFTQVYVMTNRLTVGDVVYKQRSNKVIVGSGLSFFFFLRCVVSNLIMANLKEHILQALKLNLVRF